MLVGQPLLHCPACRLLPQPNWDPMSPWQGSWEGGDSGPIHRLGLCELSIRILKTLTWLLCFQETSFPSF